jgi:uncharacterized protein
MVDPAPGRSCGSCTACCKVLIIEELQKPAGVICSDCKIGVGCGVYAERPDACRNFICAWLYSPFMGPELKPERTHVVIWEWTAGCVVFGECDPDWPDAWRAPAVINFLRQTAAKVPTGWLVVAKVGQQTWRITQNAILSEEGDVSGFVDLRVSPVWRAALTARRGASADRS